MSGHHSIRIYTSDDPGAVWCKNCLNGEYIVGTYNFREGAYVCYCDGIPTKNKCGNYCRPSEGFVHWNIKNKLSVWKGASTPPEKNLAGEVTND